MADITVRFGPDCPPDFIRTWYEVGARMAREEAEWIADLRARGIVAAHPDDGWVDRVKNTVHFVYPQFMGRVEIGSLVALGWPDKYRIVRITGLRDSFMGMQYWSFEPVSG